MLAWNDARILDESARADHLTNATIKDSRRSQWLNFIINAISILGSIVGFVMTGQVVSFLPLAVPAITVAVNIVRGDGDDEEE